MQIRLGTKQDEEKIRSLCADLMNEFGLTYDADGAESDLKNIEAGYFGRDGIFLVAEKDQTVVGFAGGWRSADTVLELVRFGVKPGWRGQGIGRKLLDTVVAFARDLDYKKVVVEPARQYPGGEKALMAMGFTSDPVEDAQTPWYLDLV